MVTFTTSKFLVPLPNEVVLKPIYANFKGLPNSANFILIDHWVGELLTNKVSSESEHTIASYLLAFTHFQCSNIQFMCKACIPLQKTLKRVNNLCSCNTVCTFLAHCEQSESLRYRSLAFKRTMWGTLLWYDWLQELVYLHVPIRSRVARPLFFFYILS